MAKHFNHFCVWPGAPKVPVACTSRAQEVLLWGWAKLVLGFEALVHGTSEAHGEG